MNQISISQGDLVSILLSWKVFFNVCVIYLIKFLLLKCNLDTYIIYRPVTIIFDFYTATAYFVQIIAVTKTIVNKDKDM